MTTRPTPVLPLGAAVPLAAEGRLPDNCPTCHYQENEQRPCRSRRKSPLLWVSAGGESLYCASAKERREP